MQIFHDDMQTIFAIGVIHISVAQDHICYCWLWMHGSSYKRNSICINRLPSNNKQCKFEHALLHIHVVYIKCKLVNIEVATV